jgi:outer membrane protein OmpA-like peptidoglycan-associated protein
MWFTANQFDKVDAVQTDLTVKAVSAANGVANTAPGLKSIGISVSGRDVTLSGETLTSDEAAKASAAVIAESGIRLVEGALTVATAQKPYLWSATREGATITLSGFVPDESLRAALNEAAARAVAGTTIVDQQKIAFGAPLGFATIARAVIPELASLAQGKASITDVQFCVEGTARSPDDFLELTAKLKAMPQTAFTLADCRLDPPTVAPYVWSAERSAGNVVTLGGFVPSVETRDQILAAAKAAFPAAAITDAMKPALGAPAALASLATAGLRDLAQLVTGKVTLSGTDYGISGQGPATFDACTALKDAPRAAAGFASIQNTITCPEPPPPPPLAASIPSPPIPAAPVPAAPVPAAPAPAPVAAAPAEPPAPEPPLPPPAPVFVAVPAELRVVKAPSGLVITGLVPSEADRAALLGLARAIAAGRTVDDSGLKISADLVAPDYRTLAEFGLGVVGRFDRGEMRLSDRDLSFSGATADPDQRLAIADLLRAGPSGARITASDVTVRPYLFDAQADKTGLVVSGYVPDVNGRTEIAAGIDPGVLKGPLRDDTRIVPGAPAQFVEAAKAAVKAVQRLDLGTARIVDDVVTVQGLTCRDLIKSEVETGIGTGLPAGFSGQVTIGLRQTGCAVDPPSTCQADLDAATKDNAIPFEQGRAAFRPGAQTDAALASLVAILQQCPAASVRIEGHTNRDGERYRFDNQGLSEQRAAAVMAELVRRGIAPTRLDKIGFGAKNPLLPHGAYESREKNRRVQFTVAKP